MVTPLLSQGVGLSALQVSVDHLQVLNSTLEELQQGQRVLKPAVQEFKEQLLALLQEPHCQGCEGALSLTQALELGADFNQVQAQTLFLGLFLFPLHSQEGLPGFEAKAPHNTPWAQTPV